MIKTLLISKKGKAILALTAIVVCAGIIGTVSKAQTEKRSANIKSKGVFDYDNGTVVMDASDLIYLADEIDLLEETYKKETVNALSEMNTYFMLDNSTTHNPDESNLDQESSSVLPFHSIIDGILASQSIPEITYHGMLPGDENEITGNISGATEENLSLGTAAWVDGELIIGNGGDNNSYYGQSKKETIQKIVRSFYNNAPSFYTDSNASVSHKLFYQSGDINETHKYKYSLYQTPDGKSGMLNEVRINVEAEAHVNRATGNYASGTVNVSYNLLDKNGKVLASKDVGECSFGRNKDSEDSTQGSNSQSYAVNLMTLSIPRETEYFQLVVDHIVRVGSNSDIASTSSDGIKTAYIQLDIE